MQIRRFIFAGKIIFDWNWKMSNSIDSDLSDTLKKIKSKCGKFTIPPGVFILTAITAITALWISRNIEFWLIYYNSDIVQLPYWISVMLTTLAPAFGLIFSAVSEIFRLTLKII